jgi:DinB superfamily
MNTNEIAATLTDLFGELVDGPPAQAAYMLNGGDVGLLRSLDKLTARDASTMPNGGGSSIAAHVDHVRYGLSLMNRWADGENPFETADWGASWKKATVSDAEWQQLRSELRDEAHRWLDALREPRDVGRTALNGIIGSIAHLAYHLGAIRQIDRASRGPAEPR